MLLTEVCHDVSLEPVLHPLSGEELQHATARAEDEARVDIAARNFWGNRQVAFFDVKVFNPFAKSNQKFSLASCFNHHEKTKRRSYEQRIIEVEHGSFTPLSSVPLGAWAIQPSSSTADWQHSSPTRGTSRIQQPWGGSAATFHSPSYDLRFCASGVPDLEPTSFQEYLILLTWL